MPSSRRMTAVATASAGGAATGGAGAPIGDGLFALLASSERLLERLYELPPCEVLEDLESAYPEASTKMRKRFPLPPRAEEDGASAVIAVVAGVGGGAQDARRRWLGAAAPLLAVLADTARLLHTGPRLLADLHVALDPLDCGDGESLHKAPLFGAFMRLVANLGRLAVALGSPRVAPTAALALQARAAVEEQPSGAPVPAWVGGGGPAAAAAGDAGLFDEDDDDDGDVLAAQEKEREQKRNGDNDDNQTSSSSSREAVESELLGPYEDAALREAVATLAPLASCSGPASSSSSFFLQQATDLVAAAMADPAGRVLQPRLRVIAPRVAQMLELVVGPAVGTVATAAAVAAKGALDVLPEGEPRRPARAGPRSLGGGLLQQGGQEHADAVVDALATRLSREASLAESWASGGGGIGGAASALARSSSANSLLFSTARRGVARPSSGSRPSTARSDLTGAAATGRGGNCSDEDEDDDDWRRRLSTVRRPSQGLHLRQQQQPLAALAGGDDDEEHEDNDDDDDDDPFFPSSAAAAPSPTAAATQFALDLEEHRRWALFALLACPDALSSPAARRLLALLLRESLLLPLHGRGGWSVPLHPLFEQAVGPTLARVCAEVAREAAAKAAAGPEDDEDGDGGGNEDEGGAGQGDDDAAEEAGNDEKEEDEAAAAGGRRGNLRQRGAELWRRHRRGGSAKKGAAAGPSASASAAVAAKAAAVVVAPEDSPALVREAWAAASQTAWRERAGRRRLAAAKLAEACDWLLMLPPSPAASSSAPSAPSPSPSPSPFAKALAVRQDALLAAISYGAAECRWYFLHAGEELRVPVIVQQPSAATATAAATTTAALPGRRVRSALKAAAAAALSTAAAAAAGVGGGSSSSFQTTAATPIPADPEALDLVHQLARAHALLARRRGEVAECAALCARRAARDRSALGQAAAALRASAAAPGAHPLLKEATSLIDSIRREALQRADALSSCSSSSSSSASAAFDAFARRLELRAGWLRLLASLSLKRTSTGGAPGGGPCAVQVAVAARDPRLFCAASDLLERRLPALEGFAFARKGADTTAGIAAASAHHPATPIPPTAGAYFDARCDLHAALAPPAHLDKLTALARAAVDAAAAAGSGGAKPISVAAAVRLLAAAPAALGALHWVARPNVPQPEAYDCSGSFAAGDSSFSSIGDRAHEAAADRAAGVILLQTLAPALKAAACQAQRLGEVGPLVAGEGTGAAGARWAPVALAAVDRAAAPLNPPERACSPRGLAHLQPAGVPPEPQPPAPPMEPLARALHLAAGLAALGPAVPISRALAVRPSDHVRRAMRGCLSGLLSGAASAGGTTDLPLPSELELRVRDLLYVCARVQFVLPDADVVGPDLLELLLLEGGQQQQAEAVAARASSADKGGMAGRGGGGGGPVAASAIVSGSSAADIPATVLAAADGSEGAILHFAPSARAATLAAAGSLAAAAANAAASSAAANAAPGRPTLVSKYADIIVAQHNNNTSRSYASLPELTALVRLFGPCAAVAVARRLEAPVAEAVAQLDDALSALAADHGGQQALKALQVAVVRAAGASDDDDNNEAEAAAAKAPSSPSPSSSPARLVLPPAEPLAAIASRLGGGRARSVTTAAASLGRALRLRALAGAALERAMQEEAPLVVAVTRALGTPSATGADDGGSGGGSAPSRHVCDVFGLPRPMVQQRRHNAVHAGTAPDPFLAALLVGTAASGARLRRWCGWPVALGAAFAAAAGAGGGGAAVEEDQDVTLAAASLAVATHVAVDRGLDLGARLLKPYGTADVAADAAALFAAAAAGAGVAGATAAEAATAAPPSVALALARHLHWPRRRSAAAAGSLNSSKGGAAGVAKNGGHHALARDQATRVWSASVVGGGGVPGGGGSAGDGACWIDAK